MFFALLYRNASDWKGGESQVVQDNGGTRLDLVGEGVVVMRERGECTSISFKSHHGGLSCLHMQPAIHNGPNYA